VDRSDEQQVPFGPLQQLIEDPLCAEIVVFAPDRVIATRRGRSYQEAVAFEHDGAVRRLVERLSGYPSAGQSGVTFELPGDMLVRALFPPITECVYLKIARPVARPERWTDLINLDVLSDEVAQFLTEVVNTRGTIIINGAPRSGRSTLLNVIGSEIADDEPTAIIDDPRELSLQRRPGLVKLPPRIRRQRSRTPSGRVRGAR
jgi:pilus assembly protein CpaF